MESVIIIGGGVGPAAGLILHRLILENTIADEDQDYPKIIHMSFSDDIPDRTDSLHEGRPDLPANGMAAAMNAALAASGVIGRNAVGGIACNTFHAPVIWRLFHESLNERKASSASETAAPELTMLNMIDETVRHIKDKCAPSTTIGILSTAGTNKEKIYSAPLKNAGFRVLEPEGQQSTHEIIYNREWGLKARPSVTEEARKRMTAECEKLKEQGAKVVILACTELPLVLEGPSFLGMGLVNPMELLARALLSQAAPDKLRME